jgi:ATP-dependent DNA helicase RecG
MVERLVALVDELRQLPEETEWAELKENNFDAEVIGKRLSALSNGARLCDKPKGYLVYGITDKSREVVGTKFKGGTERAKGQELQFWLSKELDPCPEINFLEVDHGGRRVVLIEIDSASRTPTKFKGIAYLRIGEATPRLTDHPEKEQQIWRKLQSYSWEKATAEPYLPKRTVFELLDVEQACTLLKSPLPDSDDGKIKWLQSNGLVAPDVGKNWNVLNIGALLFAKDIAKFPTLSRRQVRLVQYSDASRIRAIKEVPVYGGYALSFEDVIATIVEMTTKEDIGTLRMLRSQFPLKAIREIVANALIHQDMTITVSTPMIEVFSDRIEVRNPGESLVDTARFIDSPPKSRNEDLASLMRRMNFCEERGSGIDRVVEAVEEATLPAPDFIAGSGVTRAVLYGPRPFASLTKAERVRACYQHACLLNEQGRRATNASLRARFGVDQSQSAQVSRVFKDALKEEFVKLADLAAPKGGYVPNFA